MSSDLIGKVAVVTGGGGGIGRAVARAFQAAGASVAVVDVDPARAEETAACLQDGPQARAYKLDVSDPYAVEHTWAEIASELGGFDVLVNGAGTATRATLDRMPPEDWLRVVGVNLNGPFFCTRYAVPYLRGRGGGSIVNISSVAGKWIAYQAGVHYAATKAALLSLTRQSALELGRWNIRVNAVCPGPMENRMGGGLHRDLRLDNLPLGRRVRTSEVSDAVLFLCSPAARMVTGVDLPVDGGFLTSTSADYATYFRIKGETLQRDDIPT